MKNSTLFVGLALCVAIFLYTLPSKEPAPLQPRELSKTDYEKHVDYVKSELGVIVIDSCEYIEYKVTSNGGVLTHKGNCKNPIHYK